MATRTPPPSDQQPSKAELLSELLDEGMTMVHLDARVDGVDVPDIFRSDPHLRLNLSRRFGRPMSVEEDRVVAELTFGGQPHLCVIPFAAVFGMVSHVSNRTLMWPEDIPPEVLSELDRPSAPAAAAASSRSARPAKRGGPRLVAVKTEAALDGDEPPAEGTEPPDDEPPQPTPPRRGHLRLVK